MLGLAGLTPQTSIPTRPTAWSAASPPRGCVFTARPPVLPFRPGLGSGARQEDAAPRPCQRHGVLAYDAGGRLLLKRIYYSIGGGFVVSEEELQRMKAQGVGDDRRHESALSLHERRRDAEDGGQERAFHRRDEARQRGDADVARASSTPGSTRIWGAMKGCIDRGLSQDGIMPGGLKVRRRARSCTTSCRRSGSRTGQIRCSPMTGCRSTRWPSTRRMPPAAASSRRRPMARPACMPAVLRYWLAFPSRGRPAGIRDFLLTAAAVGGIIKTNASISGAEVGCQGEVGSASAMAAAGLCAVMGGTPGAGRERRRNRARTPSRHDLRSGRRAGAGAVHRAQCAGRGQGGDGRVAGDQGRRRPFRPARRRRSRRCARPAST